MTSNISNKGASTSELKQNDALITFLGLAKNYHSDTIQEIDHSTEMLSFGAETTYTQGVLSFLNDPLGALYKMSTDLDNKISEVVDRATKGYIYNQKKQVLKAARTDLSDNELHYCISLKKDTASNRMKFYKFFEFYSALEFSEKFPIYFQFVPIELWDKISVKEEII